MNFTEWEANRQALIELTKQERPEEIAQVGLADERRDIPEMKYHAREVLRLSCRLRKLANATFEED